MRGQVEASSLEVVAHGDQHQPAEFQLACLIEGVKEHRIVDLYLTLLNLLKQRYETFLDPGKQRAQCRNGAVRFVDIEQRIVRRVSVTEILSLLLLQRQDDTEIREEFRKGVFLFGFRPDLLRQRTFPAEPHDKI